MPALSIPSRFLMFECRRPSDENILSTPADESTSVTDQQLPVIPDSHNPYEISTNRRIL